MAQTYIVQKGETLSGIAQKLLGAASRWKELGYTGDPTKLQIGTVLTIPGAGTPAPPTAPTFDPTQYAEEKGYTKYFRKGGQWYGSVAGAWKPFGSEEEAKGAYARAGELVTQIAETKKEIATTTEALEEQKRIDAANLANQNAQDIFDALPGDEVDMRDSTKLLEDIYAKMGEAEAEIPAPTSLVDLFAEQKAALGIEPLETELAGIDADIERIQTELLVQAEEAGERLVSTREIGRAKGVLQKRADRETALLNVERSAVARQLSNKYTSLEMVMSFTQQDFTNSSKYYTDQYNRTISLFNLALGLEEREYTRAENAEKDAQVNWSVVTKAMEENGISWNDLTPDQQLKLKQYEVQGGLPEGITEKVLASVDPTKKVSFHKYSSDGTQLSVFYEDGTTEVFNTGLTPTPEEEKAPSEAEQLKTATADMKAQLMSVRGTDGYISPEDYKKGKEAWFQAGYSKDKFDEEFEMFANPSRIKDYEIAEY